MWVCAYLYIWVYPISIMGRMDIVVNDELENKFRQEVSKRLGFKKGNISVAIEEAISDWVKKK